MEATPPEEIRLATSKFTEVFDPDTQSPHFKEAGHAGFITRWVHLHCLSPTIRLLKKTF